MTRHTLAFGWMNDPLAVQLTRQGLSFDAKVMDHHQKDSEAISRLRVRGVITNSEGDRAYDRLAKRVWKDVRFGNTEPADASPEGAAPAPDAELGPGRPS